MYVELIINTIVQWVVFMIIPIILYLVFFRKRYKISHFIGFKKPKKVGSNLLIKMLIASVILTTLSFMWSQNYKMGPEDISVLAFKETGLSIQTILIIMTQTIIRTSLLEEIVFRGVMINSLEKRLGFATANHIQALIFTGLHIVAMLNFSMIDMILGIISIYLLSYYFGKAMRESGYSIFYSAVFHGILNIIGAIMLIVVN